MSSYHFYAGYHLLPCTGSKIYIFRAQHPPLQCLHLPILYFYNYIDDTTYEIFAPVSFLLLSYFSLKTLPLSAYVIVHRSDSIGPRANLQSKIHGNSKERRSKYSKLQRHTPGFLRVTFAVEAKNSFNFQHGRLEHI